MSDSSKSPSVDEGKNVVPPPDPPQEQSEPPLSKNKLKKLRRDQAWEEGRERRKELRKIKKTEKRERRRAAAAAAKKDAPSEAAKAKRKASDDVDNQAAKKPKHQKSIQLPVAFVIDCGFDDLMMDGERKSLASQISRSYSDNHKALLRSHLFISSFEGHLKERFDSVLAGHHHSWKGVKFLEGDFEEAARQASTLMTTDQGGSLAGAFEAKKSNQEAEKAPEAGEIVYLTSDSQIH